MTLRRLAGDRSHRDGPISFKNPYLVAGLLALGLTVFFYGTASKTLISSDPLANALTAWTLAEHGTVVLVEHEELLSPEVYFHLTWIVHGQDGPVSLFPPGTAILAAPAYLLGTNDLHTVIAPDMNGDPFQYGLPRLRPGIVVAATSTAIAIALLFLTMGQIGTTREALVGALIFATATGAWSVASHSLWQHGPAMMWLGVALWARGSPARELGWIPAILTRPLVGVFAAVRMGYEVLIDRDWRKLVVPGLAAAIGAGLFLLYNNAVFGSWSPLAAYEENPVLTLTTLILLLGERTSSVRCSIPSEGSLRSRPSSSC